MTETSAILTGYAKYKAAAGYEASPSNWAQGGLWELTPVKAFAWSVFPTDMTRFRLRQALELLGGASKKEVKEWEKLLAAIAG